MTTTTPTGRRWVCLLFVVALLVRSFWVPYHLATEPHQHALTSTLVVVCGGSQPSDGSADAVVVPAGDHVPHAAHDHSGPPQQRPADEDERVVDLPALPPATRLPLPPPALRVGWLDADVAVASASLPIVTAAAPRAPPIA